MFDESCVCCRYHKIDTYTSEVFGDKGKQMADCEVMQTVFLFDCLSMVTGFQKVGSSDTLSQLGEMKLTLLDLLVRMAYRSG